MNYSQKTQDLIDRMCRNVERSDFELKKEEAEEMILKTYDLFKLKRPNKIKWCVDLQDKEFFLSASSAWSAWSASSARSAWSASSARSASSASSAWSASSASSARSALSAWSASSARSALSASSASSARSALSASSALDYDFDYFVFGYEYYDNPEKDNLPNQSDKIYLEYCELLMQAKEAGLGYRVELGDTLYLVPTPIIRINTRNQYHSDTAPAIKWKGGQEVFFLNGVKFEETMWRDIVTGKMSFEDRLKIKDVDQRTQAINPKYCDIDAFLKEAKAEKLDEVNKFDIKGQPVNYRLYKIPKGKIFTEVAYYCYFDCPSTRKKHLEGVEKCDSVAKAQSWAMSNEELGIIVSPEEWQSMIPLVDEN